MDKATIQKFKSAVEAAGIETYAYVTDIPTYFYNNKDNSIVLEDMSAEIAYCIRDNTNYGSAQYFQNAPIVSFGAKFEDIHEVRVGGTYDQISTFISSLGLSLTDDQKKLLLSIASSKRPIVPPTGDYTFKELSEEECEVLTAEEKECV